MSNLAVGMVGEDLSDLRDKMIERMRADLYFFCVAICGYTFLNAPFHKEYCDAIWKRETPWLMLSAPRGGGKSLIQRAAGAARFALGLSEQNLYVSYDMKTARKNVRATVNLLRNCDELAGLFPNLIHGIRQLEIGKDEVHLQKVTGSTNEDPTFMAASPRSGATSVHCSWMFVDDLVDLNAAASRAESEFAFAWLKESFNLLQHQTETPIDIVGARHGKTDPYALIAKRMPHIKAYAWPGFWSERTPDGTMVRRSYWPKKFKPSGMEKMMSSQGSVKFYAHIQQNPIAEGSTAFRMSDVGVVSWVPGTTSVVKYGNKVTALSDLTIGVILDPAAGGDYGKCRTGILVVAEDAHENFLILDEWAEFEGVTKALKPFCELCERWQPDVTATEEVGFSSLIVPGLKRQMRQRVIGKYRLHGVEPHGRSKDVRIYNMQPIVEQKRLYVHANLMKVREELEAYPRGETDDLLDCLAYGMQDVLWKPREQRRAPVSAQVAEGQDVVTGY